MTVLEARDRVGGRVEQVELPDGRRVQLGGEVVGNGHTAYLGLVAELGLTLVPSYVAEPGEITRQVPGSVDVGDWPSWYHGRRPRVLREGRGRARQGGARDRPRRPVLAHPELRPARPAQRRRLAARGRRDARPCCGSRSSSTLEPRRRVDRAHSMFAYARKIAVGGGTGCLRLRGVGEPAGRRGVGHGRAEDGRRAARRTPVDAGRRRSRSTASGVRGARPHDGEALRRRRRGARRARPARRATSTITGVSEARLTSLRRQRHAWAAKFVAAYDEPFWRATRAERAVGVRGRDRLDLAAAGGRAVRAGAARALRRVRRQPTRGRAPARRWRRSPALYGPSATSAARRPGPGCGAPTRGRRATSRTGGPATWRRSGRCTAPTSRRSTSAAPTSGSPATWRARSAPGGPRPQRAALTPRRGST